MSPTLPRRLCALLALPLVLAMPGLVMGEQALSEPEALIVRTTGESRLNLRDAASATAAVVGQLGSGTLVRNLGCQVVEDRRWCRITPLDRPGVEGWAAAEYLVPAAAAPADQPTTAETACLGAVAREAGSADVAVLALDDSRPEVLVQVGVGPAREPWQCIVAPDGSTRGIEYLGTAARADPAPDLAEAACRAAVAQAAGNAVVMAMSSAPTASGTQVRLLVGADTAPWTCVARPDGTVTGLRRPGD